MISFRPLQKTDEQLMAIYASRVPGLWRSAGEELQRRQHERLRRAMK